FTSRSIASLEAAVLAGLGIMVLPRSRVQQTSLTIWEDAPLPELPQLYCGIYLRQGGNRAALEELADDIAAVLRPQLQVRTGGAASDIAPARASGSGQESTSQRAQCTLRPSAGGRNAGSESPAPLGLAFEAETH